MRVALDLAQRVRHTRHPGLVANAYRFHLVVAAAAQTRRWKPHLDAKLLAQLLGAIVEHQKHRHGLATATFNVVDDFLVLEEIIVDVFDALELLVRHRFFGHEDVRVAPVVAIDVIDMLEVLHPLVHPREVEVGRADEIDGPLAAVEKQPHVGNRGQLVHSSPPSMSCHSREGPGLECFSRGRESSVVP